MLDHKEPYDKQRLEFEYNQYVSEGKLNEALTVTERSLQQGIWGINIDPVRPNWYERAIALNFELGDRARAANQSELNSKYWNRAEQLYQTVITKQESLKSLPEGQLQGQPFGITPPGGKDGNRQAGRPMNEWSCRAANQPLFFYCALKNTAPAIRCD